MLLKLMMHNFSIILLCDVKKSELVRLALKLKVLDKKAPLIGEFTVFLISDSFFRYTNVPVVLIKCGFLSCGFCGIDSFDSNWVEKAKYRIESLFFF